MASSEFERPRPEPLLIVISGPSGAGKDTVVQRMKERGLPFHFVVTATTRPQRPNEVDGRDYFFVSKEEFARMIEQNELFEYALSMATTKEIPNSKYGRHWPAARMWSCAWMCRVRKLSANSPPMRC